MLTWAGSDLVIVGARLGGLFSLLFAGCAAIFIGSRGGASPN